MRYYLSIIVIIFVGCKTNNQIKQDSVQEININIDKISEFNYSTLYEQCELIQLNTFEEDKIGKIRKLSISENYIYILSSDKLYKFNGKGDLVNICNKKGKGPDEYLDIKDFVVNDDEVQLIDFKGKKIFHLDNDLMIHQKFSIDFYASTFFPTESNSYLFHHNGGYDESNYKVSYRDMNFRRKKGFFPMSLNFMYYYYRLDKNNFCKINDNVHIFHSPYDTIYKFKGGDLIPIYAINFGHNNAPKDYYEKKYNDIYEFFMKVQKTNYVYFVDNYLENANTLFLSYEHKGERKHFYFNKNSNVVLNAASFIDDINFEYLDIDSSFDNYPKAVTDSHHYYIIHAHELLKRIKDNREQIKNVALNKVEKSINNYSNPIILKMKLKNEI